MAFRYIDNNGTAFNLSNNTLRRDLMLLEGEIEDDINYPDIKSETDDDDLLSLYAKLNVTIQIITESELKQRLASENNIDTLLFIFSLNKTHFKALVYLIYQKNKSSNFFQKLIEANVKTRNRILLDEFVYDVSVEEKNFFNPLTDKLSSFFDTIDGSIEIRRENSILSILTKDPSILDINVRIYPEMYYLLKNMDDEFSRFKLAFDNVVWEKNDINGEKITEKIKNIQYPKYIILPENLYHAPFFKWKETRIFSSYLDALSNSTSWRDEKFQPRNIRMIDAVSYIMNTYFMEYVRLRFLKREFLELSTVGTGVKKGIAQAISDQNKKRKNFSFLYHLYFVYENTGNYLITLNNFDFDNLANDFNTAIEINDVPNFSYINQDKPEFTPLKNILLTIFTEEPNLRSSTTYSANYFFNIIREDFISQGYRLNRSLDAYIKRKYNPFIIPLFKNNFVILNDIVSTIGGAELQIYFERLINKAIQEIKNDTTFETSLLDPLSYNTFAEAQTGLTAIKGYIVAKIMSDVSETNPINLTYKFVLKNLIESYFDYLISDKEEDLGDFKFKANENTIKAYKVLNFVKQIFIEFNNFYDILKSNNSYINFNKFMLATKNLMTKNEINSLLGNGNSRFEDLESIFKK
jgi:hypothetical protein